MNIRILPRLLIFIGLIAFMIAAIPACNTTPDKPVEKDGPVKPAAKAKPDKPLEKVKGYHVVYLNNLRAYSRPVVAGKTFL